MTSSCCIRSFYDLPLSGSHLILRTHPHRCVDVFGTITCLVTSIRAWLEFGSGELLAWSSCRKFVCRFVRCLHLRSFASPERPLVVDACLALSRISHLCVRILAAVRLSRRTVAWRVFLLSQKSARCAQWTTVFLVLVAKVFSPDSRWFVASQSLVWSCEVSMTFLILDFYYSPRVDGVLGVT